MRRLYEKLLTSSVSHSSSVIPEEYGSGRIRQSVTRHGIVLSDWKMNYHHDMQMQGKGRANHIQFMFCRNEGVEWKREGMQDMLSVGANMACISMPGKYRETISYEGNLPYHFQSISISRSHFEQILDDNLKLREKEWIRDKIFAEKAQIWITSEITSILSDIFGQTEKHPGSLENMRLEGLISMLLAGYFDCLLDTELFLDHSISSGKDMEAVVQARKIIEEHPEEPLTYEALARMVHISPSKLAKGFPEMYGITVHQYVIDRRLELAARYLKGSNWSIGQIAQMAGYAKPSHFSSAFKEKYGVLPKDYR